MAEGSSWLFQSPLASIPGQQPLSRPEMGPVFICWGSIARHHSLGRKQQTFIFSQVWSWKSKVKGSTALVA